MSNIYLLSNYDSIHTNIISQIDQDPNSIIVVFNHALPMSTFEYLQHTQCKKILLMRECKPHNTHYYWGIKELNTHKINYDKIVCIFHNKKFYEIRNKYTNIELYTKNMFYHELSQIPIFTILKQYPKNKHISSGLLGMVYIYYRHMLNMPYNTMYLLDFSAKHSGGTKNRRENYHAFEFEAQFLKLISTQHNTNIKILLSPGNIL